jgi:RND family efflux transporter MFP subunit
VLQAPFDGVIATRTVEPFSEVTRGQTVFDAYVEESMEVVLSIPETMIREIEIGALVEASFPSLPGRTFEAVISEIGSVAETTNAFPVRAIVADARSDIRPGMTAEVALLVNREVQAQSYLVPLAAFAGGTSDRTGFVYLFDTESSTVRKTTVDVRGASGNSIAVEGISPGDMLVVAGVSFLTDGQKVRLLTP